MKIHGVQGMSPESLNMELERGAKLVMYEYCVSFLVMSTKNPTDVYFIKADENAVVKGIRFSAISMLFGWWGFPWGPIWTIGSLITNFRGGKDITTEYLGALN